MLVKFLMRSNKGRKKPTVLELLSILATFFSLEITLAYICQVRSQRYLLDYVCMSGDDRRICSCHRAFLDMYIAYLFAW